MNHEDIIRSRRSVLRLAAGAATFIATADVATAAKRTPFPADVGSRFEPDGRVHRFAGNTVICHIPQQGADSGCFDALLDVYRDAPRHSFMRKITPLPTSSYHMTVFGCANDRPRLAETWPTDLPFDLPIEQCNDILGKRLKAARLSCELPIRMKVDPVQQPKQGRFGLRLQPLDDAERRKLLVLRMAIAAATRIPLPSPDTYQFHISLGYPFAWLTAEEERAFEIALNGWAHQIAERVPVITLGAPEYCVFEDMFAFKRQFFLA